MVGGRPFREPSSVEAYSPATGWTSLPPLPHTTFFASSCVLNGKLYVAGGANCDKLQMWDPETGVWSVKADLPRPRDHSPCYAQDGKLVLSGGIEWSLNVGAPPRASTVIVYNPQTDSWSEEPREPGQPESPHEAGIPVLLG